MSPDKPNTARSSGDPGGGTTAPAAGPGGPTRRAPLDRVEQLYKDAGIRRAFCCPPGRCHAAAEAFALVQAWNRHMDAKRVRIMTEGRMLEAESAMRVFPVDEICGAIRFYSAQKWQRAHGAWKTFEAFLMVDNLTRWVEDWLAARERDARAAEARTACPASRRVVEKIGKASLSAAERFAGLPAADQERLRAAARTKLAAANIHHRLASQLLDREAIAIMQEEQSP